MSSTWSSLLTALVAVAGIVGTAWGTTADRRDRRRVDADALERERLEDLYISILRDASERMIRARPATMIIGDTPTPLNIDDELLRTARLELFASSAMNAAWHELREECGLAQGWSRASRTIVQNLQNPQGEHVTLPAEAGGMTHAEATTIAMDHWRKANAAYRRMVSCARTELNPRERSKATDRPAIGRS